jgi:hypothetical protein
MQVGDLVKYKDTLAGLEGLVGVVVESGLEATTTQWAAKVQWMTMRDHGTMVTVELSMNLEVISDASR